jgi:hypothetical protein
VALEVKHAAKALEAEEMAARLAELDAQLADKRAEGEEAGARRAGVVGELEVLLAEQDTFKDALTKAFYRWVGGRVPTCRPIPLHLTCPSTFCAVLLNLRVCWPAWTQAHQASQEARPRQSRVRWQQ